MTPDKIKLRTMVGKYCVIDCQLVLILSMCLKTVLRSR